MVKVYQKLCFFSRSGTLFTLGGLCVETPGLSVSFIGVSRDS